MANILDYLDWRGDLTLAQSEFNEVDNLLLAQLVYVDFDGIVGGVGDGQKISVAEASKRFFATHDENEIMKKVSMTKTAIYVLKKMGETRRFCDAGLSCYVNDISQEEESQFSVICVHLSDGSIYVSFSGTDHTIVGWKENFNMGFLSETPGQLKAAAYLNHIAEATGASVIRVGGHSKGGNLSVYAAVKCKPSVQEKITDVYSNDGPGFSRTMIESPEYQCMNRKIKTILPESSIVGMLLEHQGDFEVVKSSQNGIQQHDAMSWEVLGASFIHLEAVAPQSLLLDETLKNWLFELDVEQRQQIVDTVFAMLEGADITTVDEFYHSKWKVIQEVMKTKSKLPPETQQLFARAMKLLWKSGNTTVRKTLQHAVRDTKANTTLDAVSKKNIK